MARLRLLFAFPLLFALSAGLGALSPSFPVALPPAFGGEIAPNEPPAAAPRDKHDAPADVTGSSAPV
ncbi:hypothetical protein [Pendulispora albinea]|uniref:Uncharacterized protein n=1 Tax=Pendulispora albinea TaxID=2741071 RepID=A0ABZ2LNJ4_9BACT